MTVLCVAVAASQSTTTQQPVAQQPVFRSGTDLVTVSVSIRSNGATPQGLTASDFVLLDNGVPQNVEVVSAEFVPADVTVVAETSALMKPYVKSIEKQVRRIASMMRPEDRLEVLGVSSYVSQILPLTANAAGTELPALAPGGLSAINDALVAALLREPDAQRPHLIIALSDTVDTISGTSMQTVRELAKYSSSILTIAWVTMDLQYAGPFDAPFAATTSERGEAHDRAANFVGQPSRFLEGAGISHSATGSFGSNSRTQPRTGGWHPQYEPPKGRRVTAFDPLKEAAEMTGGKLYVPGVFADRTASEIFGKLYSDYRGRYVLRYTAKGVDGPGWHDVKVTIPKLPKAEIDAKRGYYKEQ
jgi:VWFA-related protein